jgi:hypothetical protein
VSQLSPGWVVKAVTLHGADITDVPTVFTSEHDGQVHIVLSSRPAAIEGQLRGEGTAPPGEATLYVFAQDRSSWNMTSPRTRMTDVGRTGKFTIDGLAAGHYYAIAIAREGLRLPPSPGAAFFELLSKEATPFEVGEGERRPLELQLWRWPE